MQVTWFLQNSLQNVRKNVYSIALFTNLEKKDLSWGVLIGD